MKQGKAQKYVVAIYKPKDMLYPSGTSSVDARGKKNGSSNPNNPTSVKGRKARYEMSK